MIHTTGMPKGEGSPDQTSPTNENSVIHPLLTDSGSDCQAPATKKPPENSESHGPSVLESIQGAIIACTWTRRWERVRYYADLAERLCREGKL
ncbi:hypothetical protein LCGC14_1143070 [marine sediment metagenome]|uniref:Uncharacterized protein n=1 Tax=marine sediment metagenome TaxID=412755 RepID=A0A0F9LXT5_9ZZZZ